MPGLQEASTGQRVIFLPEKAIQTGDAKSTNNDEDAKSPVRIVKLPKNGCPALFLINSETNKLYELMNFAESNRSWFIGDAVVEDGSLILSTPVNPIFIILPFLIRADKNVPLEDLLDDPEYPNLHEISRLSSVLSNVGSQLGDPDLNVWKYDQQKCLIWLEERVQKVKTVLEDQKIDLSGGATSLIYQSNVQASPVEYTRYALGIVSEYLPEDLATALTVKLDLPEPEKPLGAANKRQSEGKPGLEPPNKKIKHEGPTEDYTKNGGKAKNKENDLNAKQKALARSAEGTKNIMSFFKKK